MPIHRAHGHSSRRGIVERRIDQPAPVRRRTRADAPFEATGFIELVEFLGAAAGGGAGGEEVVEEGLAGSLRFCEAFEENEG